jgi:cytochrome c553
MLSAATHADTIDTTGMQPHERCASCHGLDGNSRASRFPRLAGQGVAYLKKQLTDFRTGRRTNDEGAMSIAETLSDAEVDTITRHFATQTPSAMAGDVRGDAALGRRIYLHGRAGVAACVSCHGAKVRSALGAPFIDGQHADYLQKQLIDFKRDARRNDPDRAMHRIATALTRDEIRAVAGFVSSLSP